MLNHNHCKDLSCCGRPLETFAGCLYYTRATAFNAEVFVGFLSLQACRTTAAGTRQSCKIVILSTAPKAPRMLLWPRHLEH